MKKILAIVLLASAFVFSQSVTTTITFTDSVAVTDSIVVPEGSFPVQLRMGDFDTITEFEFDFKYGSTWYTVHVPDSNYAVSVADNVTVPLPTDIFKRYKAEVGGNPLYMRLDPNDSDTTSRSVDVIFEGE